MEEKKKKDYIWLLTAFVLAFLLYLIFLYNNMDKISHIIKYRSVNSNFRYLYIYNRYPKMVALGIQFLKYEFIFWGLGIILPLIRSIIPNLKNTKIKSWQAIYIPYDVILLVLTVFAEPIGRLLVSTLDIFSASPLNKAISEMIFRDSDYLASHYTDYICFVFFIPVAFVWILFYLFGNELLCIKDVGILNFLKNRSLLIQCIRFISKSWSTFEYDIIHYDFTKKNFKIVFKALVVNFFALVIIFYCGIHYQFNAIIMILMFIIYSIVLIIVCCYFIWHIRVKYTNLFNAAQKLADGDTSINTSNDWGSFEPMKAELNSVSENVREALEKELKSQRLKTELITNVSHDLKTPLTTIITYVDLLKNPNITREQREEYVQLLDRKSQQLKVLIEDLFEVSKAVSKNIKPELREVDIIHLLKQVVFELENTFAEKNLSIRYKLADEKQILMLDSQRTYRIFENLLVNASKYSLSGTRVYIETKSVDDTYEILIKNITADELNSTPDELTERFVRGDQSRNSEGSGLGLAIAKSFAELQGGSLNIAIDGDLFKVITAFPLKNESEKDA